MRTQESSGRRDGQTDGLTDALTLNSHCGDYVEVTASGLDKKQLEQSLKVIDTPTLMLDTVVMLDKEVLLKVHI